MPTPTAWADTIPVPNGPLQRTGESPRPRYSPAQLLSHRGRYHTHRQPGAALQNTAICPAGPPRPQTRRLELQQWNSDRPPRGGQWAVMTVPVTGRPTRPPGPVAAPDIDRYLLRAELAADVVKTRQHPARLIIPGLAALAAIIIVMWAVSLPRPAIWVALVPAAAGLGWAAWRTADWAVTVFAITSRRVILVRGVLTRQVDMMPLSKVADMRFKRTLAGRLFGYGEFVIESAGEEQALRSVPYLPQAEQLYKQVNEFLFAHHGPHDYEDQGTYDYEED